MVLRGLSVYHTSPSTKIERMSPYLTLLHEFWESNSGPYAFIAGYQISHLPGPIWNTVAPLTLCNWTNKCVFSWNWTYGCARTASHLKETVKRKEKRVGQSCTTKKKTISILGVQFRLHQQGNLPPVTPFSAV